MLCKANDTGTLGSILIWTTCGEFWFKPTVPIGSMSWVGADVSSSLPTQRRQYTVQPNFEGHGRRARIKKRLRTTTRTNTGNCKRCDFKAADQDSNIVVPVTNQGIRFKQPHKQPPLTPIKAATTTKTTKTAFPLTLIIITTTTTATSASPQTLPCL